MSFKKQIIRFDTGISFKDPESIYTRSFGMNWQQTYKG